MLQERPPPLHPASMLLIHPFKIASIADHWRRLMYRLNSAFKRGRRLLAQHGDLLLSDAPIQG